MDSTFPQIILCCTHLTVSTLTSLVQAHIISYLGHCSCLYTCSHCCSSPVHPASSPWLCILTKSPMAFPFILRMKSKFFAKAYTALNDLTPAPLPALLHAFHRLDHFDPATYIFWKSLVHAENFPTSEPLLAQLPLPGMLTCLTYLANCWSLFKSRRLSLIPLVPCWFLS